MPDFKSQSMHIYIKLFIRTQIIRTHVCTYIHIICTYIYKCVCVNVNTGFGVLDS